LLARLFSTAVYLRPISDTAPAATVAAVRQAVLPLVARLALQSENVLIPQVDAVLTALRTHAADPRTVIEVRAPSLCRRAPGAPMLQTDPPPHTCTHSWRAGWQGCWRCGRPTRSAR
jgi:hypothetical protein